MDYYGRGWLCKSKIVFFSDANALIDSFLISKLQQ
jgi:hypothetical protein